MDIQNRSNTTADTRRLRIAFTVALSFALLLWMLKLVEYLGGLDFTQFGTYPRRVDGLAGVLLAPFIHGSFAHLFAVRRQNLLDSSCPDLRGTSAHQV